MLGGELAHPEVDTCNVLNQAKTCGQLAVGKGLRFGDMLDIVAILLEGLRRFEVAFGDTSTSRKNRLQYLVCLLDRMRSVEDLTQICGVGQFRKLDPKRSGNLRVAAFELFIDAMGGEINLSEEGSGELKHGLQLIIIIATNKITTSYTNIRNYDQMSLRYWSLEAELRASKLISFLEACFTPTVKSKLEKFIEVVFWIDLPSLRADHTLRARIASNIK